MMFKKPEKDRLYCCTVDVARGTGKDYSAFTMIDVTKIPYEVVATYKNNEIKPHLFPSIIEQVCKGYNHAHILCEVNDIGQQIAEILQMELEYDNMMMTHKEVELVKY